MTLEQGATGPTLKLSQAVTVDGDVDPETAPAWFIPEDQRTLAVPATESPDADATGEPKGTTPPEARSASDHGATVRGRYLDRLGAGNPLHRQAVLCLGIDIGRVPAAGLPGRRPWHRLVRPAGARGSGAERNRRQGQCGVLRALGERRGAGPESLRARIPADLPFIADAKRGDIGSTATQYAPGASSTRSMRMP